MTPSTLLRRSADVIETTVNNEPILLHSTRWQYLHFTGSGAAIWQALETPITFGDLVASLQRRFDVRADTCKLETEPFLRRLLEEQFISIG